MGDETKGSGDVRWIMSWPHGNRLDQADAQWTDQELHGLSSDRVVVDFIMQKFGLLSALAASILFASTGIGLSDEPIHPARATAPAKKARPAEVTTARRNPKEQSKGRLQSHGEEYTYRTPTGSHIPQKYSVRGREADTTLPLAVIERDDLDGLDVQSRELSGALRRFPYIQVVGH